MGYSWALKVILSHLIGQTVIMNLKTYTHMNLMDLQEEYLIDHAPKCTQLQDLYARSKTITKCTHSRRNPRFNCFVRDEFSIIMMNGWLKQCGWPADRCHRFPRVWPPCTGQPRHGRMMAGQWSERRRRNTILIDAPAREQLPQVATRLFGQMSTSTE